MAIAAAVGGILKGIGLARQRRQKEDSDRDKEERLLERELKKLSASEEIQIRKEKRTEKTKGREELGRLKGVLATERPTSTLAFPEDLPIGQQITGAQRLLGATGIRPETIRGERGGTAGEEIFEGLRRFLSPDAGGGGLPTRDFNSVQEAESANLPVGTRITIKGRPAIIQ